MVKEAADSPPVRTLDMRILSLVAVLAYSSTSFARQNTPSLSDSLTFAHVRSYIGFMKANGQSGWLVWQVMNSVEGQRSTTGPHLAG